MIWSVQLLSKIRKEFLARADNVHRLICQLYLVHAILLSVAQHSRTIPWPVVHLTQTALQLPRNLPVFQAHQRLLGFTEVETC